MNKINNLEIYWRHPWKPGGKIKYFCIEYKIYFTELTNINDTHEMVNYYVENDMKEYMYMVNKKS